MPPRKKKTKKPPAAAAAEEPAAAAEEPAAAAEEPVSPTSRGTRSRGPAPALVGTGAPPCRCESTTHQTINHSDCPLNPKNIARERARAAIRNLTDTQTSSHAEHLSRTAQLEADQSQTAQLAAQLEADVSQTSDTDAARDAGPPCGQPEDSQTQESQEEDDTDEFVFPPAAEMNSQDIPHVNIQLSLPDDGLNQHLAQVVNPPGPSQNDSSQESQGPLDLEERFAKSMKAFPSAPQGKGGHRPLKLPQEEENRRSPRRPVQTDRTDDHMLNQASSGSQTYFDPSNDAPAFKLDVDGFPESESHTDSQESSKHSEFVASDEEAKKAAAEDAVRTQRRIDAVQPQQIANRGKQLPGKQLRGKQFRGKQLPPQGQETDSSEDDDEEEEDGEKDDDGLRDTDDETGETNEANPTNPKRKRKEPPSTSRNRQSQSRFFPPSTKPKETSHQGTKLGKQEKQIKGSWRNGSSYRGGALGKVSEGGG